MSALVLAPTETSQVKINTAINQLAQGRSNAVLQVTLAASATTTVVAAVNCGEGSFPFPVPLTAHAAAELGNGTMFVSAVGNKTFTITHANNSQTDRTFGFVCLG